jgi:hypothetical protein
LLDVIHPLVRTSFTEELLELAYRNGSQYNGCVRTPFTESGALAEGSGPRTADNHACNHASRPQFSAN